VLRTRAPGMSLDKLPMFAWAMLIFAAMIVVAFPSVILATLLLELERAFGWPFFDSVKGGDPLLWQHLFWFFGHPEVYIIFLPAAGAMSTIIPAVARTPLVGYHLVVLAMLATGFISFGVWAHHMFTVGLPTMSVNVFSAASMAVSVPAGVQVFAWIATLAAGRMRFNTPGLFAIGGLVIFVVGGLSGVMVAMVPFDWQAHDTYFIVAHLHYVLIGGMVFPLFAAIYYWTPFISRRPLSERLGRWVFWLMFAGMHLAFLPMHLTGLMGMPRRVYTYLPDRGWEPTNLLSTAGAYLFGAAVLLWIVDMIRNFRPFGDQNAGNIFDGPGLEWLPADLYSVRSIPVVKSLYPLWDQEGLSRDVAAGRYFLPDNPTGGRETLVTSTMNAEPLFLLRMPKPSPWHVWAAVFTAAFFLLLTVQAYVAAAIFGALAVYTLFQWCWLLDRPMEQPQVDIGAGVLAPSYASGPGSHGWWAMVITLIVGAMVALLAGFAYVFLWSRRPDLWAPAPGGLAPILSLHAAGAVLAWAGVKALVHDGPRSPWVSTLLLVVATAFVAGAFGLDLRGWLAAGLQPQTGPQGATVAALLSWQGLFVATAAVMALYVVLRLTWRYVRASQPATFEVVGLFVAYSAGQGAFTAALPRLFPGG
jgi:cytochrome c oxidase subunit I+III